MANKKTTETVVEDKTTENTDVTEKVEKKRPAVDEEKLVKTIEDQKNIIEEMNKKFQELQSAFVSLQANNSTVNNTEESVRIGCRFINGVPIYSPKRDIEYIIGYGEENEIDISVDEMKMILKTPFVREFLRKDVLYFTNEEDYEKFNITNRFYIDDNELIKIVSSKNTGEVINTLNKYTRNKKDDPVVHSLFYRIVKLSMEGKVNTMSYETRKAIEEYFQFSIDNGQFLLSNIEKAK